MVDKPRARSDFYKGAPYPAFRFLVAIEGVNGDPSQPAAGFSDVSGLGVEVNLSEYRAGNSPVLIPTKIPNTFKADDVVLKRGLIGTGELFRWIRAYFMEGIIDPKSVTITILDEHSAQDGIELTLISAVPKKWVGPTLAGKGGGEVAMEELHLAHHGIDWK
jgi:phage tail-like protein